MSELTERLKKAQKICNDILTHKQPVLAMPVPASDDDQDIFVYKSFIMAIDALEQAQAEIEASKEVRLAMARHSSRQDQRIEQLEAAIAELRKFVDLQAEDEGLWCEAEHASEAYIQRGLRGCHAMIEQLFAGDAVPCQMHMYVDTTVPGVGIESRCLYCDEPETVEDTGS